MTWIAYDQFVDLIRSHHQNGFSGLLTGVTRSNHSFQVGFLNGEVVLLNYRILRGARALEKMAEIVEVKITEHHTPDITNITIPQIDLPGINTILSRLTVTLDDRTAFELSRIKSAPDSEIEIDIDLSETAPPTRAVQQIPDRNKLEDIKSAAIHHFGPIGAIICDEYLSESNLSTTELPELLHLITEDVGADDQDTRAFLQSIS